MREHLAALEAAFATLERFDEVSTEAALRATADAPWREGGGPHSRCPCNGDGESSKSRAVRGSGPARRDEVRRRFGTAVELVALPNPLSASLTFPPPNLLSKR